MDNQPSPAEDEAFGFRSFQVNKTPQLQKEREAAADPLTMTSNPTKLVAAITRLTNDEETSLELRDTKIGAGGAAALANALRGNKKLTAADMYNTGIGEGGVEALAAAMADGNGRVSAFDVGCNDLSLAGAQALSRLIRTDLLGAFQPDDYVTPREVVHELRLAANEIDGQACAALLSSDLASGAAEAAKLQLTLRSLALSFNPLGDAGALALGRALRRCPDLHTLQLTGCGVGAAGAAELAEGLHPARSLTHLDLSSNQLGDAGVRALAGAVPHSHLTELLLSSNGVGDAGASALGLALIRRARCPLRTLSLSSNAITDEGALALAEAISAPTPQICRLSTLSLAKNKLGPAAVAALGDAIVASHHLLHLYLAGNKRVDQEDQAALGQLLEQNRREHARRVAARGEPPVVKVMPNEAAKKLLRGAPPPPRSSHTREPPGRARAHRARPKGR